MLRLIAELIVAFYKIYGYKIRKNRHFSHLLM